MQQEIKTCGEGVVELLSTKAQLAQIYIDQLRAEEAEVLPREVMEGNVSSMGDRYLETLENIVNMLPLWPNKFKSTKRRSWLAQPRRCKKQFGIAHPGTLVSMSTLAEIISAQEQFREAEALQRLVLREEQKISGRIAREVRTSLSSRRHTSSTRNASQG